MISIKETIVVEGKDDVTAVRAAVDADIICTHGYGIAASTIDKIKSAYDTNGIIIFTDPDHAGLSIRNKLTSLFPNAKQAYLTKKQAFKKDDIGIENAAPADILNALNAVCSMRENTAAPLTPDDLQELGLIGSSDSAEKRAALGAKLGIGYANGAAFLKRLNYMNISRADIESALKQDSSN